MGVTQHPCASNTMASKCVASAIVVDQDNLEQSRLNDSEYYGAELSEEELPVSSTAGDSEDEHFSSTEDEVSVRQEVSLFSTPVASATSESSVTHADDKHVNISSEFERGCGCNKWCYEQFSVSETCDLRLSLREFT